MASGGAPTGKWETRPTHLPAEPEVETPGPAADMRRAGVRLLVRRPGVPEVEIPIDKTEFSIGRLPTEVDLVLDDDQVSRRHARLTMDERGYFKLEDLGSQNGLRFEGRTVRRLNLIDGDRFQIGRTEFTFHAKMNRFDQPKDPAPAPRSDSTAEPSIPDPAEAIRGRPGGSSKP